MAGALRSPDKQMPNPPPICPLCHQPYRATALGVPMPPLKAELVESIRRAGDGGLSTHELLLMHYGGDRKASGFTIKSHMFQINELLAGTNHMILTDGRGPAARWVIGKRPKGLR